VVPIGIAEADLAPRAVDFATDPHLLVFGDARCGKSSFLRALATSITRRYQPEQARIVLIDYRRGLLGDIASAHLIGYASAAGPATELLASVAAYMRARLPGADVTPAQLRARTWWTGPECFVLVDDFDLVGSGPLEPLVEFLPQARDIGLHLVVTRRAGGAARAMYDQVLARLRDLGTPGLVMSGSPEEGALVGPTKPRPMPPGRAVQWSRAGGPTLVQLYYEPPSPVE
jgi:S-DNA-T family DNA segregation ATPase FtsK/SpoIIIE